MTRRTQHVASNVQAPSACRQLAARVIDQALRDLLRPGQPSNGLSAKSFLAGSWMLHYWCGVAGFDPARVIHVAEVLMAGGDDPDVAAWKARVVRGRSRGWSSQSPGPDRSLEAGGALCDS